MGYVEPIGYSLPTPGLKLLDNMESNIGHQFQMNDGDTTLNLCKYEKS